VRTDYGQVNQVAQRLGAASDAAAAALQSLQQTLRVLEAGDWIGQGARAFYREMSQAVLPTTKRLVHALQSARQTTQAISRVMKQTEDAAAAVLRRIGSGQSPLAGASGPSAAASDGGGGGGRRDRQRGEDRRPAMTTGGR
jgi:WXG100 family type VII secretion target